MLISNSRFVEGEGKQEDTFGATSRYFGEPMANLGDMYYGKVKHFGMGETFFPEFSDAPKFNGLGDFLLIGIINWELTLIIWEHFLGIVTFSLI